MENKKEKTKFEQLTAVDCSAHMDKKTLERWLDVLNYWFEHIEDMGDRYPDMQPMVNKFDKVINEIYNLTKGE